MQCGNCITNLEIGFRKFFAPSLPIMAAGLLHFLRWKPTAHRYTLRIHIPLAWERPVNERINRILRRFMPKGKSMSNYTDDQILMFADEINATPRKRLSYRTPEELFEKYLDQICKL